MKDSTISPGRLLNAFSFRALADEALAPNQFDERFAFDLLEYAAEFLDSYFRPQILQARSVHNRSQGESSRR